jgi:hypothetical protein
MISIEAASKAAVPKRLRRLKSREMVTQGDFVRNKHRGFELWEGPSGFQADAFVMAVYRQEKTRATVVGESE